MKRLDLLGPDLLAEITIHVDKDGRGHVYYPGEITDPETVARIAEAIVRAGNWYAEQHGLTLLRLGDFQRVP